MKPKASSMIKFGYAMLVINMLLAGAFWLAHDHARTAMFMGGSCMWIAGILIWYKIEEQEREE
jgi:hypothetical protein